MENIVEILIIILIVIAVIIAVYLMMTFQFKTEDSFEDKIKESLREEFIIDPETGAKLTLEQAESGHWVAHDNEFRTIPESELAKLPSEREIIAARAINYLRGSKQYLRTTLTPEQLQMFEQTVTLKQYDDWSYSHPYRFNDGLVILPEISLKQLDYEESQLMFWVQVENIHGHYFFREKSASERFLDLIRNDDELPFNDYECFTIRKSHHIILIKRILDHFKSEKGLHIEINDDHLFIKTTRLVNLEDIQRIETVIDKLGKKQN